MGLAWRRETGLIDSLNLSVAGELVRIDGSKDALISEADPRTTTELIAEWEADYGLPDECTPLAATLEERRLALITKIITNGEMTPRWYQRLVENMGYDVDDLIEWTPLIVGEDLTTGSMTEPELAARFCWGWTTYGINPHMFECGVSICRDPLGNYENDWEVVCRLNKLKPSHTQVVFIFEEER